jgi:co-chaperonin GroES (HSP10)
MPEILTVKEGLENLEVGMTVMFQPHVSIDFECDGIEYVSVRYIDILAIIED